MIDRDLIRTIERTPHAVSTSLLYEWQERSAIYQYDAGLPRAEADKRAQADLVARIVRSST